MRQKIKNGIDRLLTILLPILTIIALGYISLSCGTTKYVPTDTKETIIYKDSIIYLKDTIQIKVPEVKIKEVIPMVDTSYLKTELAESIAYLDTLNKELVHTLEQKGEIDAPIDTLIIVEYLDREVEKVVTKEVEVEVPKRDSLFWVLTGWALICLIYFIAKFLIK